MMLHNIASPPLHCPEFYCERAKYVVIFCFTGLDSKEEKQK